MVEALEAGSNQPAALAVGRACFPGDAKSQRALASQGSKCKPRYHQHEEEESFYDYSFPQY